MPHLCRIRDTVFFNKPHATFVICFGASGKPPGATIWCNSAFSCVASASPNDMSSRTFPRPALHLTSLLSASVYTELIKRLGAQEHRAADNIDVTVSLFQFTAENLSDSYNKVAIDDSPKVVAGVLVHLIHKCRLWNTWK